jgi:hypothetical protein
MTKFMLAIMMLGTQPEDISKDFVKPVHNHHEPSGFVPVREKTLEFTYQELELQAIFNCKNRKSADVDLELIHQLIEIEKAFNPPNKMRGMLLAAACMESGYNPNAKGDRKFSKSKKKPMAIGILQMWPIYEKMFPGLDRTNPEQAANGWMKHIVKQIPKVKRQCRYKTDGKIWLAAWVTGIRYKKVGGRCKERPNHYRLLKKWHRNILKKRAEMKGC